MKYCNLRRCKNTVLASTVTFYLGPDLDPGRPDPVNFDPDLVNFDPDQVNFDPDLWSESGQF